MRTLGLCGDCERHAYQDESACPFCGGAIGELKSTVTKGGLSRAASHAVGAALALSVAACGSSSDDDKDPNSERAAEQQSADMGELNDGGADSSEGTDTEHAGTGQETTTAQDAGVEDGTDDGVDAGLPVAIYGGVFPDPERRALV